MRLHFSFIADALKNRFTILRQTYGPSSDYALRLNYPRVYRTHATTRGPKPGLGDLLLAEASDLPADPHELEGCSVVCAGAAATAFHERVCDIIELADGVQIYDAFEVIIQLLQRLRRIEEITKFNLDDKRVRLYLLVYFAFIAQQDPAFLA